MTILQVNLRGFGGLQKNFFAGLTDDAQNVKRLFDVVQFN